MNSNNEISSLAEYMAWVENSTQKARAEGNESLFYRGHSDANYKMSPSSFRTAPDGKSFRAVEHHLFEDMLRRDHATFVNDRTIFEKLVRMQHYGLPTRLLDLTLSPLVALYFACERHNDATGEVLLFPQNTSLVIFPSNVPDTALAGLERACSFDRLGAEGMRFLQGFLEVELLRTTAHADYNTDYQWTLKVCIDKLMEAQQQKDLLIQIAILRQVEGDLLSQFMEKWDTIFDQSVKGSAHEQIELADTYIALLKFKNSLSDHKIKIIEILGQELQIKNLGEKYELSKFLQQFTFFHFVLPPINNERIRRQQGAFVIFAPGKTDHWKLEDYISPQRIQISGPAKAKILDELSGLGMNRCYIFPEAAELAADVARRYPRTAD